MQDLCVQDFVARMLGSCGTSPPVSRGVGHPLDHIAGVCRVSRLNSLTGGRRLG